MEIVTYRELESKDELLPMFQHSFWWPYNPTKFDKYVRADPRLKNSPVGFVALKENHMAGFVGVMDIATRTLQDTVEKVGGIWGVVTHPAHAKKGVSTALMQKSHSYFKEQNYKFSLLYTSKALIAHSFYKKLGYKDTSLHSCAYKVITKKRKSPGTTQKTKIEWDRMLRLYNQVVKGHTGFVVKGPQHLKMLETRQVIQLKKTIVTAKGYVLLKETEGNTYVRELIALTKEEASKLIHKIEKITTKTVVDEKVLNENLLDTYRSHGYMIIEEGYDLLMSKQLASTTFAEAYGSEFYATSADLF